MNWKYAWALMALLILGAGLWLRVPPAEAHAGTSIAYSDIDVQKDAVRYSLRIDLYDVRIAVAPDEPDVGDTSDAVLNTFMERHRDDAGHYLLDHIALYGDGMPLKGRLESLSLVRLQDQPYLQAELRYPLDRQPEHLLLDYHPVYDDVDQWHVNYVTLKMNGRTQSAALDYASRELELGKTRLWTSVAEFFKLGVEHLLTGYDHMLFLLALLIGARSIKQILMVVTAFTCAHTTTLLLSGLHVFSLPSRLIEPIVALSIIYVAVMSIRRRDDPDAARHNVWPAFGFGLIHGFAFAGTLSEMRLGHGQLVASLFTFNVGIEAAQVGLVLLLFPLVRLAGRWRPAVPAMASVIGVCGAIWLVQRLFF